MEKTVYADILFIINFCADATVIYFTSKFFKLKLKLSRFLISSFFLALYGVTAEIWLSQYKILNIICSALVLVLMVVIAFDLHSITFVIKVSAVTVIVSVLLAGFYNLVQNFIVMFTDKNVIVTPLFFIIICSVFSVLYVFVSSKLIHTSNRECIEVCVYYENKQVNVTLLCDSGNLLFEQYNSLPVIIVKQNCIKELFEYSFAGILDDYDKSEKLKIRYIPSRTASGIRVFPAFKPDKIVVFLPKGQVCVNAMIAVDEINQNQNDYCNTDGIIPNSLIKF